ncbi:hypothetical protein [Rickettsiella endosymbiont of Rhagonycha lignosa]|uniref:hypothetical protein n=1 Tax=Rickettsiella endosymbiont of Rhagonycha lignosa TaxID=3077937 RepID=UPI00313B2943
MNERNALYLLSFLCFLLRRYHVNNGLHVEPKLKNELAGIMTSPMYNKERDREFIESRIMGNPWFMIDVCISMSLLMVSAALFFRALNIDRPAAVGERVAEEQNRANVQDRPVVPTQLNVTTQQAQINPAALFQPSTSSSNTDVAEASSSFTNNEQQTSSKKTR